MSKAKLAAGAVMLLLAFGSTILTLATVAARGSTPARAALICNSGPALDVSRATKHPRSCTVLPPGASFTEGVNLARLRWSDWGSGRARFQGISKGFHRPYLRLHVTGYADRMRPDECGASMNLYTRVRLRIEGRVYTVTPQSCIGNN